MVERHREDAGDDDLGDEDGLSPTLPLAFAPGPSTPPAPRWEHPAQQRAPRGRRCATVEGFSLHAETTVGALDRRGLERLCRYGLRSSFALSRLTVKEDGTLRYRLKRPWPDGRTELRLEPLELMRRLALLIPPPRAHTVRYHGAFAPASSIRAAIRPRALSAEVHGRHGTRADKGQSALERFAEEAPHLVPLPAHSFDTARVLYRLCSIDGFIDYQGSRYAVPYDHVTDFLPLRVTERELFIYAADLSCIARYDLAPRGTHEDIDPQGYHRPSRQAASSLEQVELTYEAIGEGARTFFRLLSAGPSRSWGAPARRILSLRERYATADIDAALAHAARYGALGHDSVERILETRFHPRRLDEYIAADTARELEAKLGYRRTERSDLAEYDRLPGERNPDHEEPSDAPETPPDETDEDQEP
jgi:hypothetical protein